MAAQTNNSGRLAFIDWTRGLAAVIMIQGHTFDSFTRTDLRTQSPFMLSQFLGGMPPAIFLFLTGITFAFLMDSQERKGGSGWQKVVAALKRSRYLFLIAFLFRIQLYIFGFPTSPAGELLKVDILNCMGMAMLLLAPMAVFTTKERIRLCTVLGLVIAGLAPVVSMIDSSSVPWLLRSYFFPSYNYFGFFPWASFLAFGMVAGSIIRTLKHEDLGRAMLWFLAVGVGVALVAHEFGNMPYSIYQKSEFWLNSPALILIKLGVVLAMLAVAWLWVNLAAPQRWSLFRQLGTTSLIVYWVHIELVYGRWFGIWKEGLSVRQVLIFTALLLVLMTAISIGQQRGKALWAMFKPSPVPQPRRASGD
ncbi:MAG TPA: heparan-alpha-glucosaminide N-acetyltransferase domain-containing protein [Bryobacteraceae bacterium]|nr:heparan-alpha-glucosaminide N-acetyltransferase domain-containing protein [Bryobacteraceae bacterium]